MQSLLKVLIDELQKEYDYLEKELNLCIKEWDFEGAEAFKKPFISVKKKLLILKNIENPNFDRITSLRRYLERIESRDDESIPEYMKRT